MPMARLLTSAVLLIELDLEPKLPAKTKSIVIANG